MPDTFNTTGNVTAADELTSLANDETERGAVAGYLRHLQGLVANDELDATSAQDDVAQVVAEVKADHSRLLELVEIPAE